MPKMLSNNKIFAHFRNLHLAEKLFIQGLIIAIILVIIQVLIDNARNSFMNYLPPIGFIFYMVTRYVIQPLVIGAINIVIINILYKTKGWQVDFWLNGIFLLLTFTTVNLLLETVWSLQFAPSVALIDIFLLSFPFGCIARFSNGGWKKPID